MPYAVQLNVPRQVKFFANLLVNTICW